VTELDLYDLLLRGDKSRDARLMSGDVVYIAGAGPQIAVSGSVRNRGIYELRGEADMTEVLRLAGGLAAMADRTRATLERVREQAAREVLEFALDEAGLQTRVQDGDVVRIGQVLPRFDSTVTLRGNVANPGRFRWRAGMRLRDVIPDKQALVTRDYWAQRNELGSIVRDHFQPLRPVAQSSEGANKLIVSRTVIESDVPEINWSYAVIERQSAHDLTTELVPFHPARLLLDNNAAENHELLPGDVVTIFSQADFRVPVSQQNRFVRLEGEFNAAGLYRIRAGETLGELVARVGGLSNEAYLFGSEFLRESTRHEQQQRLEQFVSDLDREVERTASARMTAALTPEEAASVAASIENQRRLVERMRNAKSSGRLVLGVDPGTRDLGPIKELALENGDRFVVPPRPATVNVFGAVYNQNSFLHQAGLRLKDYVRNAGGYTSNADKSHVFVIRADGSVVPRKDNNLSGDFDALTLYPGDSVVVPESLFKTTVLRALRDWSQVFSQFALGAAAVNILR
jgi:protein involved in polysaccharide export with SLBB domain